MCSLYSWIHLGQVNETRVLSCRRSTVVMSSGLASVDATFTTLSFHAVATTFQQTEGAFTTLEFLSLCVDLRRILLPVGSDGTTCVGLLREQLGEKASGGEIVVKIQLMIPSFDGLCQREHYLLP